MCFSATGSLAAAGVLSCIGVASVAHNGRPRLSMFAATPFLFAAQQLAEGVNWLTIHDADHATLHRLSVDVFLVFALIVWPSWIPLSLARAERDPDRWRTLSLISWMGVLVSIATTGMLLFAQPEARIAGHSLAYDYAASDDRPSHTVLLFFYLAPTVIPFFVSTLHLARGVSMMLIGSLIAAILIQRHAMLSVWCFFAALLSCLVLVIVVKEQGVRAIRLVR